jgi:hypothetical protein
MMKTLTGVAAAAAIALTAIAAPQPAQAHSGWVGPAIGGFAVGALVGSAVARPYYYGGGPYAYAGPAYYGPGCYWHRHRVWTNYGWRLQRVRVCR